MTKINRRTLLRSGAALAGAAGASVLGAPALSSGAWAQDAYPTKPVRFIVPLAPGGAIDFVARAVGERMSLTMGHQILVENRTGAGGTIGMDAARASPPDGYTVLITNDNAASAPHIMQLSYDYTKELLPVCIIGRHGIVLAAHASLGVKTPGELIAYAKANPGLGLATSGVGSNQHVLFEWFKRETGVQMNHVPYRGAGQAVNDLIAGHVKTAFLGPTSLMPHAAVGTIHLLAQSSATRGVVLPELTTLDEAGIKGVVLEAWYGAFAPAGTPAPIIAKLNEEMNKALKEPKLVELFKKGAMEPIGGPPDDMGKLARSDSEKYAKLVKELGIRAGN